jgi:hypothetical protein
MESSSDWRSSRRVLIRSLVKTLAQVPFDRPRADVQGGADLGVGEPFRGKAGDVGFLIGEVCGGFHGALAYRLSGCGELSVGALGEPADANGCQCLVGRPGAGSARPRGGLRGAAIDNGCRHPPA